MAGNVEQETTELALIQFDDFLKGIEDEDWIANHTRSNGMAHLARAFCATSLVCRPNALAPR